MISTAHSSSSPSVKYSNLRVCERVCAPSGGDIEIECRHAENIKSLSNSMLNLVFSLRFRGDYEVVYRVDACVRRLKAEGSSESYWNFLPTSKSSVPDCLYLHPCAVSPLSAASLLPEMRYLWKTVNISIHSMLAEYVLAHVSVVSASFMAACKDSGASFWMLASVNLWGSISK